MRITKVKLQQVIKEETEKLILEFETKGRLKINPGTNWVYDPHEYDPREEEGEELEGLIITGEAPRTRKRKPAKLTDILGTQGSGIPAPVTALKGDPEDNILGGFQVPYTEEPHVSHRTITSR